ncbi:MAG: sulfite exporter TauE/SafE family protein [Lachnospiraceae bacterium]|nr:sulfite exporter TauE/SafE family protein [Lachnospiraceae bacterium]
MHKILAFIVFIPGIIYAFLLVKSALSKEDGMGKEKGSFAFMAAFEAGAYFLGTMGFSDYIFNSLILKKKKWAEDKRMVGTMVACCIVPNTIIASTYLRNGGNVSIVLLMVCICGVAFGSFMGSRAMSAVKESTLRLVIGIAMTVSICALLFKMFFASGFSSAETTISTAKIIIVAPIVFVLGFINMFGIPMKPTSTALFLLLGLEPMSALTLMTAMSIASPLSGGIKVIKSGNYNKKFAFAAVTFGTLGAIIGTRFTVSLDANVLNIILIIMLIVATISMLKPNKAK